MLVTALVMGFAGSLHCIGMCSPLTIAVTSMSQRVLINKLLYNLGRILTYAVFGAIAASINILIPLSDFQNLFSLTLGIVILIIGVTGIKTRLPIVSTGFERLSVVLKVKFTKLYKRTGPLSTLLMGTLNGILPCGLTFVALTYCLTLNGPVEGFVYMLLFGVGTLPAMIGLTSLLNLFVIKLDLKMSRITTTLLIVSGCLLVARVFINAYTHADSMQEGIDIVLCR